VALITLGSRTFGENSSLTSLYPLLDEHGEIRLEDRSSNRFDGILGDNSCRRRMECRELYGVELQILSMVLCRATRRKAFTEFKKSQAVSTFRPPNLFLFFLAFGVCCTPSTDSAERALLLLLFVHQSVCLEYRPGIVWTLTLTSPVIY